MRANKQKLNLCQLNKYIDVMNEDVYYLPATILLGKYSLKEFRIILNKEKFNSDLELLLNILLKEFEIMEEYLYCATIKKYLDKNK